MKHLLTFLSKLNNKAPRGEIVRRDFPGGDMQAVTPRWHCRVMGVLSHVTQAQNHTSLCFGPGSPDLLVVCTIPVWSCCFRHCAERPLLSLCSLHPLCLRLLQTCKPMGHKYLVNLFYTMSPAVEWLFWKEHWTITKHDLLATLPPSSSSTQCQHIKYALTP